MTQVMGGLASRPDKLFAAQADLFNRYMDLWATMTRRGPRGAMYSLRASIAFVVSSMATR